MVEPAIAGTVLPRGAPEGRMSRAIVWESREIPRRAPFPPAFFNKTLPRLGDKRATKRRRYPNLYPSQNTPKLAAEIEL